VPSGTAWHPPPDLRWTELLDTDVPEDSYVRHHRNGLCQDTTNYFHYRVWVNEAASVTPKIWYAAAKTNWNSLSRITCEGLFHMDDLSVQTLNPFGPLSIIASSLGMAPSCRGDDNSSLWRNRELHEYTIPLVSHRHPYG